MDLVKQELLVKKSNDLILSKYKSSSILEAKILAMSLTRVKMVGDYPYAVLFASEIKKLLYGEKNDKNIYTKIKMVADDMTTRNIFIERPEKREFHAFTLITDAHYADGKLELKFNSTASPLILNLKNNFTTYELENIVKLKSTTSLRLYEILKKDAYKITSKTTCVQTEYSLAELKSLLGLIDMPENEMKRLRNKGVSWEEIEELSNPKSSLKYGIFRTRVLEKAKKEIGENTDICFDYKPIKSGRGAKVKIIVFTIYKNDKSNIPDELRELIGHNKLTEADIIMFYNDAEHDGDSVLRAIDMADKETDIKNYVGWIRSCIKNGYADPVHTMHGSAERGEFIDNIAESYNAEVNDENSQMFIGMWDRFKAKEEIFSKFEETLMMPLEMYEEYYSAKERVNAYIDWSRNNK